MAEETDDARVVALLEEWFDEASKQLEALGHPSAWRHTQVRPHPTGPKDAFFYDVDERVPREADAPLVWAWGRIAHMARAGMQASPQERARHVFGVNVLVERKDAVVAKLATKARNSASAQRRRPGRSKGLRSLVETAWKSLSAKGSQSIRSDKVLARMRKERHIETYGESKHLRMKTWIDDTEASMSMAAFRGIVSGLNTGKIKPGDDSAR